MTPPSFESFVLFAFLFAAAGIGISELLAYMRNRELKLPKAVIPLPKVAKKDEYGPYVA